MNLYNHLDNPDSYTAGVCNIGPAEIARRRFMGWTGAVLTVVAGAILFLGEFPPFWRLALFFPASLSAAGFLQTRLRFCAAFGFFGVFNMSERGGRLRRPSDDDSRAKDLLKAAKIAGLSALFGACVGAGTCFI